MRRKSVAVRPSLFRMAEVSVVGHGCRYDQAPAVLSRTHSNATDYFADPRHLPSSHRFPFLPLFSIYFLVLALLGAGPILRYFHFWLEVAQTCRSWVLYTFRVGSYPYEWLEFD